MFVRNERKNLSRKETDVSTRLLLLAIYYQSEKETDLILPENLLWELFYQEHVLCGTRYLICDSPSHPLGLLHCFHNKGKLQNQ